MKDCERTYFLRRFIIKKLQDLFKRINKKEVMLDRKSSKQKVLMSVREKIKSKIRLSVVIGNYYTIFASKSFQTGGNGFNSTINVETRKAGSCLISCRCLLFTGPLIHSGRAINILLVCWFWHVIF